MASKKRFKLPKVTHICIPGTADETSTLHGELWAERNKASDMDLHKGDDVPQPTWKDVVSLLQAQMNLTVKMRDLYTLLEDPTVAHVVVMKKTINEMKDRIEEINDELSSHVRNYNHDSRDPYY